jgi:hypothetical protein
MHMKEAHKGAKKEWHPNGHINLNQDFKKREEQEDGRKLRQRANVIEWKAKDQCRNLEITMVSKKCKGFQLQLV